MAKRFTCAICGKRKKEPPCTMSDGVIYNGELLAINERKVCPACFVDPPTSTEGLFPDDYCVVCFHPGHPGAECRADDGEMNGPLGYCGCRENVTEEQRGQIVVRVTEG